jgi:dienelactone hydrolase
VRSLVCVLLACVLLAAGCGDSTEHATPGADDPFAYESTPLRFADRGRVNTHYPIAIRDVSYTAGRDRVAAYLVLPPRSSTRAPAVIYLHGSGGDRGQFVVPATWLAARHAIGLVITAPSATSQSVASTSPAARLSQQVRLEERDVIAVRRGIDLLRRRSDVDPSRIGFVGWSAGARAGAILAGVEPRLRTLVLMSGGSTPVSAYAARAPASLRSTVRRYLTIVDPLRYVGRATASGLLLQDGLRDQVVPRSALDAVVAAAPKGTTVRWYDADHGLNAKAYHDQLAWLTRKLHLVGPPVKGALTGP